MKISKEYAEILKYRIRFEADKDPDMYMRCMWANFYLDLESGTLLACTDCEDAVHRWPETGEKFMSLMARIDSVYLLKKCFGSRNYFSLDASIEATIELLKDYQEEAGEKREAYDSLFEDLRAIECSCAETWIHKACETIETDFYVHDIVNGDAWECVKTVEDYSPQQKTFAEVFVKYLQPLIREEIASRRDLIKQTGWTEAATGHSCQNCHIGPKPYEPGSQCTNCMSNPERPAWEPMTNGDKARTMTDNELSQLWSITAWDDEYFPPCATDPDTVTYHKCVYENFTCEGCPRTFLNWLKAPYTDPSTNCSAIPNSLK